MNNEQQEIANYLKDRLDNRGDDQDAAKKHGNAADEFVRWFPKFRLYRMKPGAPYPITAPGALVVLTNYEYDRLSDEDFEQEEVVQVVRVRHPGGKWESLDDQMGREARMYWIAPYWMERIDEEEFGIDLSEAA